MKATFKCKQYVHRRKVNSQEKKSRTAFVAIQIHHHIGIEDSISMLTVCTGYLPSKELQLRTAW